MIMRDIGVSLLYFNVIDIEYFLFVTSIGEVVGGNPRGPLVYVDALYARMRPLEEYCY